MTGTERQLLNVRAIGTSFRVAAQTHPGQVAAAIGKARNLLAEARAGATSYDVRDAIAAVEAEVDAADLIGYRREG